MNQPPNPNGSHTAAPDRMAPHNVEAEEALLGCMIMNAREFYAVASFLRPGDFYIVKHEWIWQAMLRIHNREDEIDYISVIDELSTQGRLEEIGGDAYITGLTLNVPLSMYAETYGRIIQRAAMRRRALAAASDIAILAQDETLEVSELINRMEQAVFNATKEKRFEMVKRIGDIVPDVLDLVDRL